MSILRYLQGERPGMGSELTMPDHFGEKFAAVSLSPSILVSQTVLLVDVSFYQGAIDFQKMKAAGISGVIIRAGQRTWVDSRFSENWSKAAAADMPRGSYWFYDSREDPKKQAALWWSLIKDDPGELVHVADLEENYGGTYFKPEHFRTFVSEFQRLSGLPDERIAIYTGYYWWIARVGPDLFFKRYPLWLAWYADMSVVRIPGPWSAEQLLFWQWTSSGDGTKYGVSSLEIDLNWYCCSQVHFEQRFNLTEPTNGGTMTLYEGTGKLTSTPFVRVRKPNPDGSLNADGMTIGQINPGQGFRANGIQKDALLRDWLHITEVGGKPIDGWSAAWLLDYAVVPVDPPPPTGTTYVDVPYSYVITLGGQGSVYLEETIAGSGTIKVKTA